MFTWIQFAIILDERWHENFNSLNAKPLCNDDILSDEPVA